MRARLLTPTHVLSALRLIQRERQDRGYDNVFVPVMFPSGRHSLVDANSATLGARIARWLQRYLVWLATETLAVHTDGITHNRTSSAIIITPTSFGYRLQDFTRSVGSLDIDIHHMVDRIDAANHRLTQLQHERSAAVSIAATARRPTSLAEIEEAVGSWPESLGLIVGPAHEPGSYTVVAASIAIGFIPVAIMRRGGRVALTSTLLATISGCSPYWADGQDRTAHPHVSRSYCLGSATEAMQTMGRSNQVIGSLGLIRQWRLGYNPHDAFSDTWSAHAWGLLQHQRTGRLPRLLNWDGQSVQRSDTGEVVPLESLVGNLDIATHVGRGSPSTYLSRRQIRDRVGASCEPMSCISCKQLAYSCACHDGFCVGCQESPAYCYCTGAPALVITGHRSIQTVLIRMPEAGKPDTPVGCRGAGHSAVAVVWVGVPATERGDTPPVPTSWRPYCEACLVRISGHVADAYAAWDGGAAAPVSDTVARETREMAFSTFDVRTVPATGTTTIERSADDD